MTLQNKGAYMFDGKMKAVTFSYDDNTKQDYRLVEIFKKYGLKCTFNVNSGSLGQDGHLIREGVRVDWTRIKPEEVKPLYQGHEVAVHTLTHPNLKNCDDETVFREVEEDRLRLSELVGYEVVGMAYPGGTGCFDERVVDIIRNKTGVKYARTTTSTHNFNPQTNLLEFNPTVHHHTEWDKLFELGEKFVELETDKPQIFYIWGHSFEFDIHDSWDKFEEICKLISGRKDIFYGTNKEVLL